MIRESSGGLAKCARTSATVLALLLVVCAASGAAKKMRTVSALVVAALQPARFDPLNTRSLWDKPPLAGR